MLRKTIYLTALIGIYCLPAQANTLYLEGNNKFFYTEYMVEDNINALDKVRLNALRDVEDPILGKKTQCDRQQVPKFVDINIKGSRYGSRYGYRTYFVDVYYTCS